MVRWLSLCVAVALFGCGNERTPSTREVPAEVVAIAHPSLRMFDAALAADAMHLSDVQIVALTAARAPLVAAIARLEGARHAYAEALASAVDSKKLDDATLALAAADLSRTIDQFGPVEHTAKQRLFDTLDERQQALLGPWPDLGPNKIDLDLDRAKLVEAFELPVEDRAKLASKLRAGAPLR